MLTQEFNFEELFIDKNTGLLVNRNDYHLDHNDNK